MPTKDVLVSQKFNNFNYAPGIATYGIDGKTGQTGLDGNNIYFTNCNIISDNDDSDIEILADLIRKNVLPVKGSTEKINRKYKNNDLFFDINGIIFKLIDIDALLGASEVGSYVNYFSIAGKITVENAKVFASGIENINNRLIFNSSDYSGYDIIKGIAPKDGAEYIDTDAAVNIISNVVNDNDNIEMVKMQSIDDVDIEDGKLSVYYKTTENAYYLESNKPIVINSDVKLNTENNTNNEYDNFSTVLTSNDTITYFKHICDKLRYNILYDSDVNRYKLVIYQDDGGSDDLEYLVNRSETVYGKVYDGENDQILIKLANNISENTVDSSKYYENLIDNIDFTMQQPMIKQLPTTITFYIIDGETTIESECNINGTNVSVEQFDDFGKNIKASILHLSNNLDEAVTKSLAFRISNTDQLYAYKIKEIRDENNNDSTIIVELDNSDLENTFINKSITCYKDGIYKYDFNSSELNNNIITIDIFPWTYSNIKNTYIDSPVIHIQCELTNVQQNSQYSLYFTVSHTDTFNIEHIILSQRQNLNLHEDVEKPCIISYLPDSIESVQRFSLLHNTEVFINYQE